jgi:hypothetical protein
MGAAGCEGAAVSRSAIDRQECLSYFCRKKLPTNMASIPEE